LFVAIPAVLGYNALARRNKAVIHQLNRFAHDLHAFFLTGARVNISETSLHKAAENSQPLTRTAMGGAVKS
jgi:biopolymer transport protein ExbB